MKRQFSLRFTSRSRRRGSTLVLLCFGLIALIGFAAVSVDYGLLVMDANRLQRSADAAALAGATKLAQSGTNDISIAYDTTLSRALALNVANQNGATTITANNITFPAFNKIKVAPTFTRQHYFARILGFNSSGVARQAIAGRLPVKGIRHAVPLAMTIDDFNAYKDGRSIEYKLIRNQDTDFIPGTVASVDLRPDNSGKSGANFQEDLTYGYDGIIYLNDKINNSLTADIQSQGKKLDDAMAQRFLDALNDPSADTGTNYIYPNYPSPSRRIMYLIVANQNPADNGNPTLEALFFVPVYIESTRSPAGKQEYLRMRILPWYNQDPNLVLGDDSTPFVGQGVTTLMQ